MKYITAMFALSTPVVPEIRYAESHYEHRMIKGVDHWGLSFHIVIQNITASKKAIGEFARLLNEFVA
jgi:tRNA(Glu) U13 pseudouridine synthase TruD